jgi:DNA repair protein RadC
VLRRPIIRNRHALLEFLQRDIGFSSKETVLALFLDLRLGLIKAETLATGTVSQCPVDVFALLSRGKELGAAGFMLAHNHPSGDAEPSRDDIQLTDRIARIGADLDMPLLEHIIVAGGAVGRVPIHR